MAAHQLVYSLWSLTSFATVPLEQVALAFIPLARGTHGPGDAVKRAMSAGGAALTRRDRIWEEHGAVWRQSAVHALDIGHVLMARDEACMHAGDWELAQTSRVVIIAGATVGVAAGAIACVLAGLAPWAFTSDATLYPIMRGLAPQVFASMILCGVDVR